MSLDREFNGLQSLVRSTLALKRKTKSPGSHHPDAEESKKENLREDQ